MPLEHQMTRFSLAGNTNAQYLESKVLTASQPRLHLMLIEGAVRQCIVAQQAGAQQFWGEFDAALGKTMDIVEELTRSVAGKATELTESLEEQYAFLYRALALSRFDMNLDKLSECAKLLEFHRETWKQVCDSADSLTLARPLVIAPQLNSGASLVSEGFSFEA
jgi:flagellar biosynthetic protein FliS